MNKQTYVDKEEQRIIAALSTIKNSKCKRIVIDGLNIIQKQNKVMLFSSKPRIHIYDEDTRLRSEIEEIRIDDFKHTLIALPNGNIAFFGGHNSRMAPEYLSSCRLLDTKNNIFTNIGQMNERRYGSAAVLLRNGLVLIIGGLTSFSKPLNSCELFDPTSQKFFLSKAKMSIERHHHTASLLPDGRILICGGWNDKDCLQTTEIYDPLTDSFSQGPQMLDTKHSHTATTLLNGNILICDKTYFYLKNATEIYDSKKNLFIKGPRLLCDRHCYFTTLLPNGKVFIGDETQITELYDPKTNSISRGSDIPTIKGNFIIDKFVSF